MILWTARAAGFGKSWADFGKNGLLDTAEVRLLTRAESFLRHARIRMHYLAKRREEKLLFDYQEGLAQAFGLERTPSKRASEVVMQGYYQNAKLVMQLNLVVLQNLGARLFPDRTGVPRLIDENFQITRELIDVPDLSLFERDPSALLRIFRHMQDYPEIKGITARTLGALWRNRKRIDAKFRRNPANRALFMDVFKHQRPVITLQRMNQFDILGQYLPAFGKIVGQMQHDLFHVYTVDQHIMQVVRNLRNFVLPECAHEYPFCTRLALAFENYWLLYLAALFHDIAKGRGGDHSKLGMSDARTFCRNHGLSKEDTKLIVFLVEQHLTMSTVAQKQDLGDPEVIRTFANMVKDERTLTALYLLTVSDIRGTSPKVWNGWKGKLLEDLYRATLNRCAAKWHRSAAPRKSARKRRATSCATWACARMWKKTSGSSWTPSISCVMTPRTLPCMRVCCTAAGTATRPSPWPASTPSAKACRSWSTPATSPSCLPACAASSPASATALPMPRSIPRGTAMHWTASCCSTRASNCPTAT